jgi:hypothetical protein
VVIRGGGVDGDNCEIHTGRGRYPGRMGGIGGIGGPVYIPIPRSGGIGSSRFPMAGRGSPVMPSRTASPTRPTMGSPLGSRVILSRRGR